MERLLIANRGEIAVRIARTAHRMGISTVGVYSEPDRNAMHVDAVDTAVALGGSTPAESYLRGDAIIDAALGSGADAIHPGYGFLSENADFAQAVSDAGLIWVGPTPKQISLLGDKITAKRAAVDAGVPTTHFTEVTDGEVPTGVAMPALVKAAGGGGGRGMRIVNDEAELADALEAASREAEAAFGDRTVFIEPYISDGRHIEVQIMGDKHGNVIHLGERECSIQRRNQKVIEESPSASISDATRTALLDGALALARHVGYENAGTVEFLVADDGTISFLEVNTRLQVEHPVTESVTGLDLVELQLLSARGEHLAVAQDDVQIDGHAIEVRIVAEDPSMGWMPSTGTVGTFDVPDGPRVDSGFRSGSEVSPDYDSMLAKIITHGSTRLAAATAMRRSLSRTWITGVTTNVDCLAAIMGEPDYLAANTPTSYLDTHPEVANARGPEGSDLDACVLAATFALEHRERLAASALGFAPSGWRNLRTRGQRRTWISNDDTFDVEYVKRGAHADVRFGPPPMQDTDGALLPDERTQMAVRVLDISADVVAIEIDGVRSRVRVQAANDIIHTSSAGGSRSFALAPTFVDHETTSGGGGPICPLPGTVIAVHVSEGDSVVEGQLLMVVEAMKMEHKINADQDGSVVALRFGEGDRVDSGDLLVELAAGADNSGEG